MNHLICLYKTFMSCLLIKREKMSQKKKVLSIKEKIEVLNMMDKENLSGAL